MKTAIKVLLATLIATSSIQARGDKPYEVKSIKIEFTIKAKDKIGKKRVLIDDYGNRELEEINIVEKSGGTVSKFHRMHYLYKNISYIVDFNQKAIYRKEGYMGATFGINKFKETMDESLKAMHLKKVGTDTVAGVECDVWQIDTDTKFCYYKGLPLRTQMNGEVEVATKVELDTSLSKEDFKLPDYVVYGVDGEKPRKYTQSELEAMDKKYIDKHNKDIEEVDQRIAIMKEAYKKAGVVEGKAPTKEQLKIVEKYMQNAMFPEEKRKMLKKGEQIIKMKLCYEKAQNLDEAKSCDPSNRRLSKWNDSAKKAMMKEMQNNEKIFECIKSSSNMQEMKKCFPKR